MPSLARIAAPLAVAAACLALAASGADRRESRPVSGFDRIALAAPVKVELTQSDAESLTVEGDEGALADLETVVEDGALKIRSKARFFDAPGMSRVRAYVSAKNIQALSIAGSGDISAGALRSERLKLAVSGSGDIRIASLASTTLTVAVSGSGDVTLGGKADEISTSIAGSGDLKAGKLETRQAKISIAGSGDCTLWAKESLSVKIAGSGDVRYFGDPALTKSIAGSGSVRRMGATPS